MKREIDPGEWPNLIAGGPLLLVSSRHAEKISIITVSWSTPLSLKPPMVAVSVGKGSFSAELIKASMEFVINVPHGGLLKEILYCGTVSGRHCNKFEKCSLTPVEGKHTRTPSIAECCGYLECRVKEVNERYDSLLFIAKVLGAAAEEGLYSKKGWDLKKIRLVHHLSPSTFELSGDTIAIPERENGALP